jgi:hypothetical protein
MWDSRLYALSASLPENEHLIPTGEEAGLAPEPSGRSGEKKISIPASAGNRTLLLSL